MKIKVIGSTKPEYVASKEELDVFGGHSAGMCYLPNTIEMLFNESIETTKKRIERTKTQVHHSVYGHSFINLILEDVPKALAMVLNNEGIYNTSEKSARYTKMELQADEQIMYDKWLEIFKDLIRNEYQEKYPNVFTESKIEKLAQENARYLISVFTPTSMVYTVSYQQLNYLYQMFKREIECGGRNAFMAKLVPYMQEFCKAVEDMGYYDDALAKGVEYKNRYLNIVGTEIEPEQYFGDVYCTNYEGSFAELAQAQRHRTIDYNFTLLNEPKFYVPPIIRSNQKLVEEWAKDCDAQASVFPQGMLVNINECGKLDWFIQKMKERKCFFAQLEINQQTDATLNQYVKVLKEKNHPRAEELETYTKGSRCTFADFTCPAPCGMAEAINGTRVI